MNGIVQEIFSNKTLRDTLFKLRFVLGLVLLIPLARYMRPELLPAGLAVSLFGQLIQTWCFASLVKNRELSIRGPYLMVRNPMYLGRYFLILGFLILLENWLILAGFTALYYVYMYNRVKREERRLKRHYKERFDEYTRNVHRFLPSLKGWSKPDVWFFDLDMFLENNAHWNILGTVLAYVAVFTLNRFI